MCASDRKQRAWTWPTSSSNSRINLNCQAPALAVLFPLPPSLSRCSIESTTLLVHYYCTNAAADAALSFHRKSRRQNCERHFGQLATRHFSFSLSFNKRQFGDINRLLGTGAVGGAFGETNTNTNSQNHNHKHTHTHTHRLSCRWGSLLESGASRREIAIFFACQRIACCYC